MRKPLFAIVIFGIIICLSAFESSNLLSSFQLDPTDINPDLPETPFEYSVEIPEHLVGIDDFWGFYETIAHVDVDDDKATLGRVLFYDEIISANLNMSCATCHKQEKSFADDVALSIGTGTPTRRNSMQLNDLGWTNHDGFFWDMRSLDLQEIISVPLTDENEIGLTDINDVAERMMSTEYYPELFNNAYGANYEITEDNISEALFHFIQSINSLNSTLDQNMIENTSLTNEQEHGREIYSWACASCHAEGTNPEGIEFFPFIYFNGQSPTDDPGMGEFHPAFEHGFKIPTLRNIALTAPYMHDGSMETLEEVITHYSEEIEDDGWGFIPPEGFQFAEEEKDALLAFMLTFTDESMTTNEKWADPFASDTSSIISDDTILKVDVFPNPTSDILNLRFNNLYQGMIHTALYNPTGQLIRQSSTHGNVIVLNVSNEPAGIYYVHLTLGEKLVIKEVVIN